MSAEELKEARYVTLTKTEQLKILFEEWKMEQRKESDVNWAVTKGTTKNISKNHFGIDGIIDEPTFEKEQRKVLFISAEANIDEYSAKKEVLFDSCEPYREYYKSGYENWNGRMKERLSNLYRIAVGIPREAMTESEAAIHYAVMDINKRGGGTNMGAGIELYCELYAEYIRREIEIIDPDLVIVIGIGLYNLNLHGKYLGGKDSRFRPYFMIGSKKVPIVKAWQTSYYEGRNEPLPGYEDNRTLGKQAAFLYEQLKSRGLLISS